ncbi:hypothetical protein OS189_08305 [Sulfitobacter sp. F26169L]|uniref:hypothetical protein n=1 Tax=Sulfitobacter sp. F26169L TaxID=2996015 RepID=UPI002260EF7D|nr:hypothetical protein [Sulfitobacter sp. F26169L]MCX7566344.1 hypothetical protein [Sulfitobacter sp. F26169L]
MNSAVDLLRHALNLVIRRPLTTVSVVAPALVLMCGVGLITAVMAPELLTLDPTGPELQNVKSVKLALILLTTFILSYALMAILWHRHTLSETGNPSPMSASLVFGYLWRVMALAFIQLVAGLVLVVPLIAAGHNNGASGETPALISMLLTTFVTQLLMLWLSLRLSLILPAAALGRPIKIKQSWRYTRPISRTLWGVAAGLAFINTTLTALVTSFELTQPAYVLALELPIYIIEGLLIFSVLTTLYAQQIQRKDPDGL